MNEDPLNPYPGNLRTHKVVPLVSVGLPQDYLNMPKLQKEFDEFIENVTQRDVDEWNLVATAQNTEDDQAANEAMRLLRENFDPTYGWCEDCDGLVCKEKDCCMNKFINAQKPTPPDIAKFMDDNFFDLLK